MDSRYRNSWDRDNFYYHRKDPTPWAPIDEPLKATSKIKEGIKVLAIAFVVAVTLGYVANARADVIAHMPNKLGGKIAITDAKCKTGSGFVAYSTNPTGESIFGCWVHDNTFVHILWYGTTSPNSYDLIDWTVVPKNNPTM